MRQVSGGLGGRCDIGLALEGRLWAVVWHKQRPVRRQMYGCIHASELGVAVRNLGTFGAGGQQRTTLITKSF